MVDLSKTIGYLFYTMLSFVHHYKAIGVFKLGLQSGNPELSIQVKIGDFLSCVTLKKFDGWSWKLYDTSSMLLQALCIIFKPWKNWSWSYSPETPNFDQTRRFFFNCVTFKFDGWPWKTIWHLFYPASSLVHHSIAINEFKLELQSGNAQFGSKSAIFFVLCDLKIWRMTLKNNRARLLSHIKLCASFHRQMSIQTGVTVRKRLNWVLTSATLSFDLVLDLTSVIGNHSWKFHDDTMMGT